MAEDIKVAELTTYSVGDDGTSIVLRLNDSAGQPVALTFSLSDLGMLAMTLPTLIEVALRRQSGDQSLRYTHPMSDWSIEQSNDPAQLIITLKTPDGFGVSFLAPKSNARKLVGALSHAVETSKAAAVH